MMILLFGFLCMVTLGLAFAALVSYAYDKEGR